MSGFKQDINQISPNHYRVTVVMSGGTATFPTADGTDNGAVNPSDWNMYTTSPTTLVNATRVARGNIRWQAVIEELTKHSDAQLLDVTVSSAGNTDANNQPTALAFTVKYERDQFVLDGVRAALFKQAGNYNDIGGNAVDTVAKAIRHLVVSGIQRGGSAGYTRTYRVYNPTLKSDTQVPVTVVRPDADADVYADVTVALVDTTTLVNA